MPNVQITLPVEHADELLGLNAPAILPALQSAPGAANAKAPAARAAQNGAILPMVKPADEAAAAPATAPATAAAPAAPAAAAPATTSAALPAVSVPGGPDIEALQSRIVADTAPEKPWSQLGRAGKIGRVLGDIGIAAGGTLAPRLMEFIPGTPQHRMLRESMDETSLKNLQESQQSADDTGLKQAQAGYYGAEIPEIQARGELAKAQAKMYESGLSAMNDPKIQSAFGTLSDPQSTPEQRRNAMSTISQSPIGMLPMFHGEMSGAENIYRQGEEGSRVRGHNIIPDKNSPTGYSTLQYDALGQPIGIVPVMPSSPSQILMGPQEQGYIGAESALAGSKAAAEEAQKLIPIIDPQTNDVIAYAPKGKVSSATGATPMNIQSAMAGGLTPAPEGSVKGQAQNAVSIQSMINRNILPAIGMAEQAGELGPAAGRVQDFLLRSIGNPDDPAAKLQATLEAVPMMLGSMYHYRSADYARHMNEFLNTRMTPSALRAYLSGILEHASVIAQQGGMGPKTGTTQKNALPALQPGKVYYFHGTPYLYKGGDGGDASNWQKVNR